MQFSLHHHFIFKSFETFFSAEVQIFIHYTLYMQKSSLHGLVEWIMKQKTIWSVIEINDRKINKNLLDLTNIYLKTRK